MSINSPRRDTKLAEVLALIEREVGASIEELTSATGWLPHTTRAALTGLRKRAYTVLREGKAEGGSVYRITGMAQRARPEPMRKTNMSRQPATGVRSRPPGRSG